MEINSGFNLKHTIHELKHYLPAQAPLKDFIHHNTLHAFQKLNFFDALRHGRTIFGYKTTLQLNEYRELYKKNRIKSAVLKRVIESEKGITNVDLWMNLLIEKNYNENANPRVGKLYSLWNEKCYLDLESFVLPKLFRILCSYLDQGISIWEFPMDSKLGFIENIRAIEANSIASFFATNKAKKLLLNKDVSINMLLSLLVGENKKEFYQQYIFDQQFLHPGWSGLVSVLEDMPESLLIHRKITLHDLILVELLLEYDTICDRLGDKFKPLGNFTEKMPHEIFSNIPLYEIDEVLKIWQLSFEWSWYDEVLNGITNSKIEKKNFGKKSFQAIFCIDDRECSFRRYVELFDENSETFGTPGFFGVEFFFKPQGGKFVTKVCPAPITPKYLIKEMGEKVNHTNDPHFSKQSHNFLFGWFITQSLGFWSALRLFINLFRPSMLPATATSLKHMDQYSELTIENNSGEKEDNLQIGFNVEEMTHRVESVLKSIGLVKNFASIVYVVGHGSSSVNNPHYAAYDCGACSGRAGSANARVFSYMANHKQVRLNLALKGIEIPESTVFVGAIHDTTRDEMVFFDTSKMESNIIEEHRKNEQVFLKALDYNAKERSRRFVSVNSSKSAKQIHKQILYRSVSLFEPRPELNHATNAVCIIGRRDLSVGVFLDRRSFLNSYDYIVDPDGKFLLNILNAAAPVCGGINLEYYFSRVDNDRLGAGTKLPHNVMGLIGVANGTDGDLRPGLPSQMIEVHDPIRLLMIVEHFPEVVLKTIITNPATYEWFINEWIVLIVINPETKELSVFKKGKMESYKPSLLNLPVTDNLFQLVETHEDNLPVYILK